MGFAYPLIWYTDNVPYTLSTDLFELFGDVLIRDTEPAVIQHLKLRTQQHHRSLQGELKYIIESSTKFSMEEAHNNSTLWHKKLKVASRKFSDSTTLMREE